MLPGQWLASEGLVQVTPHEGLILDCGIVEVLKDNEEVLAIHSLVLFVFKLEHSLD
jgi:hypothetical protein